MTTVEEKILYGNVSAIDIYMYPKMHIEMYGRTPFTPPRIRILALAGISLMLQYSSKSADGLEAWSLSGTNK